MDTADLRSIAVELDAWDSAGAARIRAVAAAVENPDAGDGWAGVDARDAVALDSIIDRLHDRHGRPRLVSQLERIRNLLVLVPILITWAGLLYAASAYSDAVGRDPSLIASPFLLLWEQGFQGHLGSYPLLRPLNLSTVAFIDVAVIVVILVLTWIVHGQTSVAMAAAGEETRDLEARLHVALWAATLEFRSRGSMSAAVDRFGRTAKHLLDELKAERTHLEELVKGRERRMNEMRGFTDEFRTAANDLSTASNKLAVTVGVSVAAGQTLAAAVQTLSAGTTALGASIDDVGAQASDAVARLTTVAKSIDDAMGTMIDAAEALGSEPTRIGDSAEVLRGEIADLRRDLEGLEGKRSAAVDRELEAVRALTSQLESLEKEVREFTRRASDLRS
jgi:methyl-accepting chemotaxis protein